MIITNNIKLVDRLLELLPASGTGIVGAAGDLGDVGAPEALGVVKAGVASAALVELQSVPL